MRKFVLYYAVRTLLLTLFVFNVECRNRDSLPVSQWSRDQFIQYVWDHNIQPEPGHPLNVRVYNVRGVQKTWHCRDTQWAELHKYTWESPGVECRTPSLAELETMRLNREVRDARDAGR